MCRYNEGFLGWMTSLGLEVFRTSRWMCTDADEEMFESMKEKAWKMEIREKSC